jgi:hypothetical protein
MEPHMYAVRVRTHAGTILYQTPFEIATKKEAKELARGFALARKEIGDHDPVEILYREITVVDRIA